MWLQAFPRTVRFIGNSQPFGAHESLTAHCYNCSISRIRAIMNTKRNVMKIWISWGRTNKMQDINETYGRKTKDAGTSSSSPSSLSLSSWKRCELGSKCMNWFVESRFICLMLSGVPVGSSSSLLLRGLSSSEGGSVSLERGERGDWWRVGELLPELRCEGGSTEDLSRDVEPAAELKLGDDLLEVEVLEPAVGLFFVSFSLLSKVRMAKLRPSLVFIVDIFWKTNVRILSRSYRATDPFRTMKRCFEASSWL